MPVARGVCVSLSRFIQVQGCRRPGEDARRIARVLGRRVAVVHADRRAAGGQKRGHQHPKRGRHRRAAAAGPGQALVRQQRLAVVQREANIEAVGPGLGQIAILGEFHQKREIAQIAADLIVLDDDRLIIGPC